MARKPQTVELDGQTYTVKRHRTYGRYVEVKVENLTPGMSLDQGTFRDRTEAMFHGEVNPRTWEVWLVEGMSYIESRGASVRVWL